MKSRAGFDRVKITKRSIAYSRMSTPQMPTIAIVGGGFSGALVAIHLLRTTAHPLHIKLIERRSQLGKGVAYSTEKACHLLNVPAHKVSAFADDPDHFLRWLRSHENCDQDRSLSAHAFASRQHYGQYVQSLLQDAITHASPQVRVEQIADEAVSIRQNGPSLLIALRSGNRQLAGQVVLALGNPPSKTPALDNPSFYQSPRYIASAWSDQSLLQLDPDAAVLLIGSGLTAIDVVLTLRQQGHRAAIHLVSRRGLLPQSHQWSQSHQLLQSHPHPLATVPSTDWCNLNPAPHTTRQLLRHVRQQIEQANATGQDWRSIIDALRPHVQTLWQTLSLPEKQRFLRHVCPYWEVHRHRMAPSIAQQIETLLREKSIFLHAARIQAYDEDATGVEVMIRQRHNTGFNRLRVQAVVNCTGPEGDYCKSSQPLIVNLLATGLIRSDSLHLGLDVAPNGALITADGMPSTQLYTLGFPMRGLLWETTAISEIRSQAKALSKQLLLNVASIAASTEPFAAPSIVLK